MSNPIYADRFITLSQASKAGKLLVDLPCEELSLVVRMTIDQLRWNCIYQNEAWGRAHWDGRKTLRQIGDDAEITTTVIESTKIAVNSSELKSVTIYGRHDLHELLSAEELGDQSKLNLLEDLFKKPEAFKRVDGCGRTLLFFAAGGSSLYLLECLFAKGIYGVSDCSKVDINGESPLEHAIRNRRVKNVLFLFQQAPQLKQQKFKYGLTFYHLAIFYRCYNNLDDFDALFSDVYDAEYPKDDEGRNLLHYAAYYDPASVAWVADKGFSNSPDNKDEFPLHFAAGNYKPEHEDDYALLFDENRDFLKWNYIGQNVFHSLFLNYTGTERAKALSSLINIGKRCEFTKEALANMFLEKDNCGLSPLSLLLFDDKEEEKTIMAKEFPKLHTNSPIDLERLQCVHCHNFLSHPVTVFPGRTLCATHLFDPTVHGHETSLKLSTSHKLESILECYKVENKKRDRILEAKFLALREFAGHRELIFQAKNDKRVKNIRTYSNEKVFYYPGDPNFAMPLVYPLIKAREMRIELNERKIINLLKLFAPDAPLAGAALGWDPSRELMMLIIPLREALLMKEPKKFVKVMKKFEQSVHNFINNSGKKETKINLGQSLTQLAISSYEDRGTVVCPSFRLSKNTLLSYLKLDEEWQVYYINSRGNLVSRTIMDTLYD